MFLTLYKPWAYVRSFTVFLYLFCSFVWCKVLSIWCRIYAYFIIFQPCMSPKEFSRLKYNERKKQCSSFDKTPYLGNVYKWMPYIRGKSFINGTKYSRMDQVKSFKGCLPQILLGPFLNTLTQICALANCGCWKIKVYSMRLMWRHNYRLIHLWLSFFSQK